MKTFSLLFLLCLVYSVNGQELTDNQLKKADRNAQLEIKNLPPKGWTSNIPDVSFESMISEAWKMKFSMENTSTPKYVYTFGNGQGKNEEEAFEKAKKKADAQVPGLLVLYFSTWNMAARISEEEKSKIAQAIEAAEKAIGAEIKTLGVEPKVNMIRTKGSKTEIHLRYYYNQLKLREYSRKLIVKELKKTTDWSEDKMTNLLTYEK